MFCWVDGKFLKERDLKISPFNYGFLYGYNVFEVFRTYQGKVVFFQEHFQHLIESLMNLHMEMPYTILQLKQAIEKLTEMDENDAIVHLVVSSGKDVYNQKSKSKPKVMILRSPLMNKRKNETVFKWKRLPAELKESFGQKLITPYEMWENTIYYTDKDIVVGSIHSTIFWGKNDILYTPRVREDCYWDITRKWVILTAKQLGIRVIEDKFIRSELEDAYECFISNSIDGIIPISQMEDMKLLGKEGPIYERIHHAYLEEIFRVIQGDRSHVGKI